MPETFELSLNPNKIKVNPQLPVSKSICNRQLIIQYVSNQKVRAGEVSDADDSRLLEEILRTKPRTAFVGAGGTTLRFAMAYFAASPGSEITLRGTGRLHERPQAPLIDALRYLGAEITCLERDGCAPVHIKGALLKGGTIELDTCISSQFASALLLVAPLMANPLKINFKGSVTSLPYLHKTCAMLQMAGVEVELTEHFAALQSVHWKNMQFKAERDWTAASYWYGFAALNPNSEVYLEGLSTSNLQGDKALIQIFEALGVSSIETSEGIILKKKELIENSFSFDASSNPDLVQSLVVVCVGLSIPFEITGLATLVNKETNRIVALQSELAKINVNLESDGLHYLRCTQPRPDFSKTLVVSTYEDHRMAMSFAMLVGKVYRLAIRNPSVVNKSYPAFWKALRLAGVDITVWDD
jgi:3-phosphoshikimate 1-carboxyvinyltransferase